MRNEKGQFIKGSNLGNTARKGLVPWNKKKQVLVSCRSCNSEYLRRETLLNPFCSRSCYYKSKKGVSKPFLVRVEPWNKGLVGFCKGEKHGRWVKDRSLLKKQEDRGGARHKEWSRNVKDRDGWKCKISNGECSGRMESHHILGWTDHPELRYEVNNGITLCHFHHPRKRNDEMRLSPYFQELVNSK